MTSLISWGCESARLEELTEVSLFARRAMLLVNDLRIQVIQLMGLRNATVLLF
jgi:hypothetical protein